MNSLIIISIISSACNNFILIKKKSAGVMIHSFTPFFKRPIFLLWILLHYATDLAPTFLFPLS